MIRKILLPLDSMDHTKAALELAGSIAKRNNAEISGIVVLDIPSIESSIGMVPAGATYYAKELEEHKVDVAVKHINVLLDSFREFCKTHSIRYHIHTRQGTPSNKILEHAMFYDLLFLGNKNNYHINDKSSPIGSFDDIMDHSATPIISVPSELPFSFIEGKPMKTVIAFDGSVQSVRAIQRFAKMRLFDEYDVKIVMADDDPKLAAHYLEDCETYLKSHDFENIETIYINDNIIEYTDNFLYNWADMFVLGAHSKKVMLDFMFGSLTKHLIKKGHKILFTGQ